MNRILYTLLALFLTITASGQVVITDSTTTPSICFNDGTIHVVATGGTGPYTFSITTGPAYPGITYPIALPPLASTFLTMPRGTYTIKVVDASGNVSFATATVGGTYSFPTLTYTITNNYCITVTVTGGRPPYRYAISSTSTGAGFGPYQNSPTFCVCNGHYWVRVMDSCSNIYTTGQIDLTIPAPQIQLNTSSGAKDTITTVLMTSSASPYTYQLHSGGQSYTNTTGVFIVPPSCKPDTVTITDRCGVKSTAIENLHDLLVNGISNCTQGDAVISIISDALPPYTITGPTGTVTTNSLNTSINGLPLNVTYNFTVTDSCGNTVSLVLPCSQDDTLFFEDVCPFDSSLHLKANQIHYCFPVVVTCLNCVPQQVDTAYSVPSPVFTNIDTGVSYTVRIQDQCGFDYTTQYTTYWGQIPIYDSVITCSDFAMHSVPRIFVPPVHYSVFNATNLTVLVDSITANDPIFFHVAAGTYKIIASHVLCRNGVAFATLPYFGGRCVVPMMDSSCTPSYAVFQPYMASPEVFTLVNTASGASYTQQVPRPGNSPVLFSNIPVGNYNLVSDSGCSIPYVLPAYPHTVTATYNVECTGQSKITATVTPPVNSCNTSQKAYFTLLKDNQYQQSNTSGVFIVSDTGYFVIKLFLSNTTIFGFPAPYDTICPLDTFLFYVRVNPTPGISAIQQEVCGHNTGNIPYTIIGGTPPYTVQIQGYPTRTVTSNIDTFPNVFPGVYTMIVSDFCGISRSISVAVVDTCSSNCITQSNFALSDSIVCRNARIGMQNLSAAASHYKWLINGVNYGYRTDTSFATNTPGRYTVTLYAYIGTCVDSSKRSFVVEDTLRNTGVRDTFLCLPFNLKLNTHNGHSVWSTGASDSIVTLSAPGMYWVQVSNSCGIARDSFNVGQRQSPLFNLTSASSYLCADEKDSTLLTATLIDSSGSSVIFRWSTGYFDSAVYHSQVFVYQADTFHVAVTDSFCPVTKDIIIAPSSCDSLCLAHIAIPDAFSPNGDGKNDTFYILHFCSFDPYVMHIYNRWGEKVFESVDIDKGWDGRYKGVPQPDGAYWFWISLSIEGKKPSYRAGKLMLMR